MRRHERSTRCPVVSRVDSPVRSHCGVSRPGNRCAPVLNSPRCMRSWRNVIATSRPHSSPPTARLFWLTPEQRDNRLMQTHETAQALRRLFTELSDGTDAEGAGPGGFVLNSGDVGLLRSLDRLSAAEASQSTTGGATIAAHAQHLRYGLSLMNRWAAEGGNPFADATWDEAWKITVVDDGEWTAIRNGLRHEAHQW